MVRVFGTIAVVLLISPAIAGEVVVIDPTAQLAPVEPPFTSPA